MNTCVVLPHDEHLTMSGHWRRTVGHVGMGYAKAQSFESESFI